MKIFLGLFFLCVFFEVKASKIDQVMTELKRACPSTLVARPDLIGLVRDTFLTCESGTTIQVRNGCEIPCLKENMGNIVGGSEIEWD